VDMVDSFGYNALLYACDIANQRFPNQKIVSHLLAADADVDHANEITKETPLMMATRRGHTRVSKMLLDANAEVHAQAASRETALFYACRTKEDACTRLLLQRKASVDHTNDAGQNALHIAATHGNDDVIVQLLTLGAADHINVADHLGMSPLMIAAQCGWHHMCRVMLTLCQHTDATLINRRGLNAIELARLEGHRTTAEEIERLCADRPPPAIVETTTVLQPAPASRRGSASASFAPSASPSRRGSAAVLTEALRPVVPAKAPTAGPDSGRYDEEHMASGDAATASPGFDMPRPIDVADSWRGEGE